MLLTVLEIATLKRVVKEVDMTFDCDIELFRATVFVLFDVERAKLDDDVSMVLVDKSKLFKFDVIDGDRIYAIDLKYEIVVLFKGFVFNMFEFVLRVFGAPVIP